MENGSNDKTYEKAKRFEGKNITIISSSIKGVSAAKNLGIRKLNKNSDWVIFLDADTILKSNFLQGINNFLKESEKRKYVVGTTSVRPFSKTTTARFWFAVYNFGHRIFKTSYSIQIIKRSLLDNIHFDERLTMAEDLKFIKDARKYGKFFYFPTADVYTSTRRFEQIGWIKIFFSWIFGYIIPSWLKRRFTYKVIR